MEVSPLPNPAMPTVKLRLLAVLLVPAALAVTSTAAVARHSPALDRVSLWLGGYRSGNDTNLAVRSDVLGSDIGGALDFEDDLGLRRRSTDVRARLDLLVGDAQGFSFDYHRVHRAHSAGGEQVLPEPGGTVGASVRSRVGLDFGSVAYTWWMGEGTDVAGVGLGAAYYRIDARVEGSYHGGGDDASIDLHDSASAWAPMLTLGWRHAFGSAARLYVEAAGVRKNGGDLEGHIWNGRAGVEWFPWRHAGLALEYSASRARVARRYDLGDARLRLQSHGPAIYLRTRF